MPISFQLAGSAHCLPPGRCVMATPPPPPPTLGFQGQGGQLPISRGGSSGGTRLRVVGSCEGARLGRLGFSSAQLASPSEATPPKPRDHCQLQNGEDEGARNSGPCLGHRRKCLGWGSCQLHRPESTSPLGYSLAL